MNAYFSNTDTKTFNSHSEQKIHQISDAEHSRRAKADIANEWEAAKQREVAKILKEKKNDDNLLLRANGLDANGVDTSAALNNLTPKQSDVLLASEPDWVKDSLCNQCNICSRSFTRFGRRKHHCRFCGSVVCAECSKHRMLLPLRFPLRETARVCIPCHQRLEPVQPILLRLKALKHRTNDKYNPENDKYRSQLNFPVKHTLSGEVRKAAYSVRNLFNPSTVKDHNVPASLLKDAKGLLFITVVKIGFIASARIGTGLVIAKLPNGHWSAPSAVYTGGFGFGAQAGGGVTDFVTVLMTNESVRQFTANTIGSIGASIGVSLGAGRCSEANASVTNTGKTAATYTYSQARGLFAGVALELGGIRTRHKVNQKFYGRDITPLEILSGREKPPIAAAPLYNELKNASIHWGGAGALSPAAPTAPMVAALPPQQKFQVQNEDLFWLEIVRRRRTRWHCFRSCSDTRLECPGFPQGKEIPDRRRDNSGRITGTFGRTERDPSLQTGKDLAQWQATFDRFLVGSRS